MCDGARGLRGRGAPEDGLLARPDRPRRCTLPMTALRVIPPSSPAIWLAERPSDQSFLRSSTRSSVQFMFFSFPGTASQTTERSTESTLRARACFRRPGVYASPEVLRNPPAARDVVVDSHKTYNMA